MSKTTGKAWSEGYHFAPNSSKYLAGDPDVKFVVFDASPDNSEDEELVPCLERKLNDGIDQVKSQEPILTKEINLVLSKSDDNEIDSQCSTSSNDLPLSPSTREDMIQYLNFCASKKLKR
jgi:hypothetical protein